MIAYVVAALGAVYLGLLTSISPCPLATNIAAISYVGRKVDHPRSVLYAGLLYTLGRTVVYLVLVGLLVHLAVISETTLSILLQQWMTQLLGPILVVLGMFLLGWITFTSGGVGMSQSLQQRIDAMGLWGALAMGALFALSFCPTSAAWFFALISLVMGSATGGVSLALAKVGLSVPETVLPGSTLVLPLLYGIATAAPVVLMAALLAYGAHWAGKTYHLLGQIEYVARLATGWLLLLVGMYFTLFYVFDLRS